MKWFFAENGQQQGPVSEVELTEMRRAGRIAESALVWCDGMPGWEPLEKACPRPGPPLLHDITLGPTAVCAECQQIFPVSELVSIQHLKACARCKPALLQRLREGAAPVGMAVWRHGRQIVITRGTQLPDRCVKCNAPSDGIRLKRRLYWHPPALYILLISPLIYIIVASIISKRATLEIGLCALHRARRRWVLGVAWFAAFWGIYAGFAWIVGDGENPALLGGCLILILGGLIGGISGTRMVSAAKIDGEFIRLRGTGPDYREALPEWPVSSGQPQRK